jgi:hypothetical protein
MFLTTQLVPGSTTEYMRLDPFSCLPELSGLIPGRRSEIGVFCHEFGHALGLPDLYDTSALDQVVNVGPGNWSLMSTGAYGGNGIQPELPAHLGGWASAYLGWSSTIRPAQDTTITITPMSSGGPVVEFWFQGESNPEHFLLENPLARLVRQVAGEGRPDRDPRGRWGDRAAQPPDQPRQRRAHAGPAGGRGRR